MNQAANEPEWATLSDEALLKMRICDLNLSIQGSELEPQIKNFYSELEEKKLNFRPEVYLGDEWFSPEGMNLIAVPFYLVHPRLKALEHSQMLEIEGGRTDSFAKLIRHEAGHCFDHAYKLSKKRKWKDYFDWLDETEEYDPDTYIPQPYSRNFVRHLPNWYAQSHPDEDFAETFAVWMTPKIDWRKEYSKRKGALQKLECVEWFAKRYGQKEPKPNEGTRPYQATRMRTTLGRYYLKKKKYHAEDFPDFYDRDLNHIFDGDKKLTKKEFGAGRFLQKNRKTIVSIVSRYTGAKKYTINGLVKKLTKRCESNNLRIGKPQGQTNLEIAAWLASMVTHYQFTGQFKRGV